MLSPSPVVTPEVLPRSGISYPSSPLNNRQLARGRHSSVSRARRLGGGGESRLPLNAEDHVPAAAAAARELGLGRTAAAGESQWAQVALAGQATRAHRRRAGTERRRRPQAGRAQGAGREGEAGRAA